MLPQAIAHYEVGEKIGAGGMGEVYRARDTKLNRDVALKILPEAFADDRDRMARFEREAQVLASLNHSNIAAIHGLEVQDGTRALVLELVPGETLSGRIAMGSIPLDEALDIAKQIAEALEAAHEVGIIHRDLKPANVIVTEEGHVKVLDFGLAKALEGGAADDEAETSPTMSFAATRAGVILGTAAYMSPEQARGHKADRRSDIWSFGVVLFEMLSGKRLFSGDTPSDVLAHVLTAEPGWEEVHAPGAVKAVLRRCLTRERKRRLQAIGEARIAIEDFLADPVPARDSDAEPARGSTLAWTIAGVFGIALLAIVWMALPSSSTESIPSMHFSAKLDADGARMAEFEPRDGAMAVLSPDGRTMVFVGSREGEPRQLYLRALDQLSASPLSGTEDAHAPFFSPDGKWVGFFTADSLKKVSLTGGAPLTLVGAINARGGTWGPDGTIVFTPDVNDGLLRVPAAGGDAVELTNTGEDERSHRWPTFLPNGNVVLFVVQSVDGGYDDANIEALFLDTGERRVVHRGGTFPRYLAPGHLVFLREATLFGIPFDAENIDVTGEAMPVLAGLSSGVTNGAAQFAVSSSGTLMYKRGGTAGTKASLAIVGRTGENLQLLSEPSEFLHLRLSPDETRAAVSLREPSEVHVHVFDLERRTLSRLTFDARANMAPVWSPDGARIAFSRFEEDTQNIYWTRADGAGDLERLTESKNRQEPEAFSPDGKFLLYREASAEGGWDLWVLPLDGSGEPVPFLVTPEGESDSAFSPDGKWVAYTSRESGRYEIYIQPFPGPGGKYQVSNNQGRIPRWAKGGRELVYVEPLGRVMAVSISVDGNVITPGIPESLFEGDYAGFGPWSVYDVAADGERFLVLPQPDQEGVDESVVTFVLDFVGEVRRLAGE